MVATPTANGTVTGGDCPCEVVDGLGPASVQAADDRAPIPDFRVRRAGGPRVSQVALGSVEPSKLSEIDGRRGMGVCVTRVDAHLFFGQRRRPLVRGARVVVAVQTSQRVADITLRRRRSGAQFRRLLEHPQRVRIITLRVVQVAQVRQRRGRAAVLQAGLVLKTRVDKASLLLIDRAQQLVAPSVVGHEIDDPLKGRERAVEPAGVAIREPQAAVVAPVVRAHVDGLLEARERLVPPAKPRQDLAAQPICVVVVRLQVDGCAQLVERLCRLPDPLEHQREGVAHLW